MANTQDLCGERAYPIRLPIFRQEDADKVIGIFNDQAAFERFIAAHPNFGPVYDDYRVALGPSVDEIKVSAVLLAFFGRADKMIHPDATYTLNEQSKIRNLVDKDSLLMMPSRALATEANQHDRFVIHYLHTMALLNAYVQEAGEPIDPLRASLGAYWALTSFTKIWPGDRWHAHLAHRLLLWSSFSPSGSSAPNQQLGILALYGLREFLQKSLSDPLHQDAAGQISMLLEMVPNA